MTVKKDSSAPSAPEDFWLPSGAQHGAEIPPEAVVVLMGRSGCGKTHTARQLCFSKWITEEGLLLLISEQSGLGTLGADALKQPGVFYRPVTTYSSVMDLAQEMRGAREEGKRLPKTIVYDGLFGSSHHSRRHYEDNPIKSFNEKKDEWVRDTRAGFAAKGYGAIDGIVHLRDLVRPYNLIITATTHESAYSPLPELAVEGAILPKNLTALSTAAFYMKMQLLTFSPEKDAETVALSKEERPHLHFDRDDKGNLTGKCMKRMFLTQDTGEVLAKGHRNLSIEEKADLPNVLRKLHGLPVIEWWKETA